jgi:uncharacterized repeat protein (TIGR01451 family)
MNKHSVPTRRFIALLVVLIVLASATLLIASSRVVRASDSGWHSPNAAAADTGGDGNGFEVNPMEAYADGDDYARNMNGYNDRHRFYNFGFDSGIPADAIIIGIEVRLDGWADSTSNTPRYEVELSGNGGVNWTASRSTSTLNTSEGTFYLGGQNDLWQSAWEVSDLLDNNFRVRITSRALGTGRSNRDFFLDWIVVRVHYASAHIGGIVWSDDNADGVQDNAENGLSGVHITIYQDDGDGIFEGGGEDPNVGSTDTDASGVYDTGPFSDGHSYWIDVNTPANRYLTTPPVPQLVILSDGSSVAANFGYAPISTIHPGVQIAKTPDQQQVLSGSTVTFTIAVTNTGDVILSPVVVSDALASNCDRTISALAVGAPISYQCTQPDVIADFTNTIIVSATPPVGQVVTDIDTASVKLDLTQFCPADMVAYWKLDENSGPSYADLYDVHPGECAGECPTAVSGHIGMSQQFNGRTTGLSVGVTAPDDAFNWNLTDSFSVELWMKADNTNTCPGNQVIVGRDDSYTPLHWWVGCQDGGQPAFYLKDTNGTLAGAVGTTPLGDGIWHHLVAIRDAATNEIRVFVDGKQEQATPATFTSGFSSASAALNIGWLNLSQGYHFSGAIDDVAVYRRSLPADEIRRHYNEGLAGRWYCESSLFAPKIVSVPVANAMVGRPYRYTAEAVGSPAPLYALDRKPNGMTVDPVTGLITWVPNLGQEGSHDVEVKASNSMGTDAQLFTITVKRDRRVFLPIVMKTPIAGLIADWNLNETGGSIFNDSYGGHDGVCAGQCPAPTSGYRNGGQAFDGSKTGIDVPSSGAFNWRSIDSFSIEFRMRTEGATSCSGNQVAIGRDDNSTPLHWWVGCQDGGQAAFYLRDTTGIIAGVAGTTRVTDGAWHHIVAVRDAYRNRIRIYVDLIEEGSTDTTYTSGFESSTAALNIGWLNAYHGYHFRGTLDEVVIYGQALSPGEGLP